MIAARNDMNMNDSIMNYYDDYDKLSGAEAEKDEYNPAENDENGGKTSAQIIHKAKAKDKSFRFIAAQTVICIIVLLIIAALKFFGGDYYSYAKSVFDDCFNTPINKAQVLGSEQARAVVAAQSTVYGMGGENTSSSIRHISEKNELSDKQVSALKNINSMTKPVDSDCVTCEYGWRIHPISKKRSFHTGIDIGEDMNRPIYSVLDGVVKRAVEDDGDYGNYLVITHSDGVETMYAHCSKLLVKKGQSVKKGEQIAKVGTTGLSTGPHLHFEVRINDTRLNPRWFLNI